MTASARHTVIYIATAVLALLLVGVGLWAMIAPHAFYENAALYQPYNRHFIHDIGALAIGLGSCLLAGLVVRDALLAVLAGNTVGAAAHFISHVLDRSLGGNAGDPVTFGIVALVFAVLTLARWMRRAESGRA